MSSDAESPKRETPLGKRVSKKFDEGYDTYIVDKHTILNVKDIHRRGQNPDQTNLFE